MHIKTLFNRVTEYKPFVVDRVDLVEHKSGPVMEVTMRARGNGQPECSGCGHRCPGYDTLPTPRRFDFIPLRSRIEPMPSLAKTLRRKRDL